MDKNKLIPHFMDALTMFAMSYMIMEIYEDDNYSKALFIVFTIRVVFLLLERKRR